LHTLLNCRTATLASFTGGKLNRGLSVVHTVLAVRGAATTEREARLAAVAGWCLEWLQAFFLVADDVMDGSVTRRGQPCWYKRPAVGLVAFNDSCCLLGEVRQGQLAAGGRALGAVLAHGAGCRCCALRPQVFVILKRYFRAEPYYVDLLELFQETVWQVGTA